MLIKFETKSNRVKGLAFHPKRPWILASLHNGLIQLWDYRMGTLLDQYDEHEGPVRSVDFHRTQPLFVSGGDDYKIKVWSYKTKRCLFTLVGHMDYIRTVEFHLEQPWIVSASDDQTVRIWNWQSRTCIAVLTGHNHYVMCASFHPTDDLVVSASLDQSVRVWDVSGLKKKSATGDDLNAKFSQLNQDLFGTNDVMVKYILEGHDRGVNWATFHPNLQLIISAADDRQVKLWRINETKAWEVETLTGHMNNVSCARFHAKKDLIVTNSEDKTIRIYRLSNNQFVTQYRRENDRFWVVATHPFQNLIAAGHDSGLMIFKLERERPQFVAIKDSLFYVKDKYLRKYTWGQNSDNPTALIRRTNNSLVMQFAYNPQENCILLTCGQGDAAGWELYKIPKSSSADIEVCTQTSKGKGIAAVLTGVNKFAVLQHDKQKLSIRYLSKDQSKEVTMPVSPVDNIFGASSGRLLLKTDDKIHMYDLEQGAIVHDIAAAHVRNAVWSEDGSRVALISKHGVIIANNQLQSICSVHETIRIKSGAFDENSVFIYSTMSHMKYCLPNGDAGTIKTLDAPIYIAKVKGNQVAFLDRETVISVMTIDSTEYRFKMALLKGQTRDIKTIIGQSKILGDSIIAYLQQRGYPDIAMKFVEDDQTKFDLAIECGNIDIALQAVQKLDQKEAWQRLGAEALRQGNFKIVEKAYQQNKDFDRLSFLYLISGNITNLQKMLKIAGTRGDIMSKFHNALFLGEVEQRVQILQEAGLHGLAYSLASTHGLTNLAEEVKKHLTPEQVEKVSKLNHEPSLLMPPTPILREGSWPLLHSAFAAAEEADEHVVSDEMVDTGKFGADSIEIPDSEFGEQPKKPAPQQAQQPTEATGFGEDLDIPVGEMGAGFGEDLEIPADAMLSPSSQFMAPSAGKSVVEFWPDNSNHAADHIAAGSFNTAMQLLNQQCAIVNFAPLKEYFQTIFAGSRASIPITPMLPSLQIPLQRVVPKSDDDTSLPVLATASLAALSERLKVGLKNTTDGLLDESVKVFRDIVLSLLFAVLPSKKEEREARELLTVCADYVSALRIELARRQLKDTNPQRSSELAAYFTRCKLNSAHVMLGLSNAMTVNFKAENFGVAAEFAKKLTKMSCPPKLQQQVKYVMQMAEQKQNANKHTLNYDDRNPCVICNIDLVPIYAGSENVKCGYCKSAFLPKHKGKLCTVCEVAEIGTNVAGISQFKQVSSSSNNYNAQFD